MVAEPPEQEVVGVVLAADEVVYVVVQVGATRPVVNEDDDEVSELTKPE